VTIYTIINSICVIFHNYKLVLSAIMSIFWDVGINEKSISHEYKTGKVLADNLLIINIYIQYILHLNEM